MTADTYRREDALPSLWFRLNVKHTLGAVLKSCGYGLVFATYATIFIISIATLGLIEIREANFKDFNALVAMLEQRDRYSVDYFNAILLGIADDRARYQDLDRSLDCSGQTASSGTGHPPPTATACDKIKEIGNQHLGALWLLEQDTLFRMANLPQYYDQYTDGLREKTPQLIPVLRLADSSSRAVTLWARLPFELLEMLLLVCMGALGGIISVTRCFVDPSTPNPTTRDLCYRPVAAAVIALGIYILFRAGQLFFGGSSADGATTSVFVLAALGLASGFCAREAVSQIESVATRLLRRSQDGRDDGPSRTGSPAGAAEHGANLPPPVLDDRPPPA
jgi:hypothetical protein